MKIIQDIDIFVKSRYPLIYLVSFEEERVITELSRLAESSKKELFIWSCTQGIYSISKKASVKGTENPLNALEQVIEFKDRAFFIFKDFHHYLEEPFQQYLENPVSVRRKLRDTVLALRGSFKTLFILSPVLKIPCELEKDIVIVDFPLPDFEEIKNILHSTLVNVAKHHPGISFNITDDLAEKIVKACLGMTASEVENVFAKAIVNDRKFDEQDLRLIVSEKKQIIRKAGMLEYFETVEEFSNVGGLNNMKDWLQKRSGAFSDKARAYGLPEPKGLLLLGVQGCGKSLVSKCISSMWRLPLLRFDVGNIFGKYVGESEENLRKALRVAEALSPTILWMDEIEKAFAGVGGGGGDAGLSTRIFGSFITWLQEKTAPVFVIATANSIENLPPELLRKGRFDEIFFVDLPSGPERAAIFKIHLSKRKRDPGRFSIPTLVDLSEGFSGAEIEQSIISSMYDAFYENRDIETSDIEHALRETVPLSHTMKEKIDYLRDWAKIRARQAT